MFVESFDTIDGALLYALGIRSDDNPVRDWDRGGALKDWGELRMTTGELKRLLEGVRDDLDVFVDFNGNGWEPVRKAVVGTVPAAVVLTNMEDYET